MFRRGAVVTVALVTALAWLSIAVAPAAAQTRAAAAATSAAPAAALAGSPGTAPLNEVAVAANAFVRGGPLPAWADLAPVPPARATRRALAIRLDETQLYVADTPVQLVNTVQQANDPGVLGQIGQISLQFIPQYQRLTIYRIAIIRAGQVIDHTLDAPVRFLQRETGLEQGIYSGAVTASLLLPDVRVGDTLQLQYALTGANPIFAGKYGEGVGWQRQQPIELRRVTLISPVSRPVRWHWVTDGDAPSTVPEISTERGMRRMRFEARDLPGVDPEPMLPRGATPLAWLEFTEFADWGDVARWADALFQSDNGLPAELRPWVERWAGLPSKSDQASQALQWVQTQIRYYSVSLGENSHRPHSPTEVLRNRYGDCKDKTLLLMRILQALGIRSHAALASLSAPQRPALMAASPIAFDHVVVQAHIDGRDYFLDPTRLGQRGPLDRMGQGLEAASVLVVDPGLTSALTVIKSPNRAALFRSELTETFGLSAFGEPGTFASHQTWIGLAAESLRLTAARLDTERLKRALLQDVERRYAGAAVVGTPVLTDDVDRNTITVDARYTVPKLAEPVEDGWAMRFVPANLRGLIVVPPSTDRRFALALPAFPTTYRYRAEMQWPTSVSAVRDPASQHIADAAFASEVTAGFRGNLQTTEVVFEPLADRIEAKNVAATLADIKRMEQAVGSTMRVGPNELKNPQDIAALAGKSAMPPASTSLHDTLLARARSTIERTGRAIDGGQLTGEDLAQALCQRSGALSELGRFDDAGVDADRAVQVAPALGAALACRGNARWEHGAFGESAADYSRALVLGVDPADVYYRRGQARFFEGKLELAADDFTKAAADRVDTGAKGYARLWLAWTSKRLGRPLPPELLATASADPDGTWPLPALAMLAGRLSPDQVLAQIDRKTGDDRQLALAEGWFYIGEYWLGEGNPDAARTAFEKARAVGITLYLEYAAAGFELQRLSKP